MSKIKIGIIGPGIIFWKRHYPYIVRNENYIITDVLTASTKNHGKFNSTVNCTNNENIFFKNAKFDAVIICSPIYLHYHHIIRSLTVAKWVFVEKPVVGTISEVNKMGDLSKEEKKRIFVAENYRYLPSLMKLEERMKSKNIKPVHAELKNFQNWFDEKNIYAKTEWRKYPKHEGGLLFDYSIHLTSVLTWLFKDLEMINSNVLSLTHSYGKYDTLFAKFSSNNNTIIHLALSYALFNNDDTIIKVYYPDCYYRCTKTIFEKHNNETKHIQSFEHESDIVNQYAAFNALIERNIVPKYNLNDALEDARQCLNLIK